MRQFLVLAAVLIATLFAQAQTDEQKAIALVKKMTLEEKIGQMTQVTFAVIAKGGWADQDGVVDPAALKKSNRRL